MKGTLRNFLKRWFGFASPAGMRIERFFDLHPLDLTTEEIERFELRKRELLAANMPPVALAMAFAALAFWPFDLTLFANHPQHAVIFGQFRVFVAAFLVLGMLVAWRSGLIRRAPEHVAGVMSVIGIGATGWFMGRLEGLDGPWFTYLTAMPLTTVLILTRLRTRVIVSFAAMGAAWVGVAIANPDAIAHVWRDSIMTQYLFTTLLGIMTGHVIFVALRANAVAYQRLDVSRQALDALKGELESLVEQRTSELRDVLAVAEDVRERERTWVVREIHDMLGQELLAVSLSIALLRKRVSTETAANAFEPTEELLRRASSSVRRILRGLSATLPDHVTAAVAMREVVNEVAERAGIAVTFACRPDPFGRLQPLLRQTLFRILQEAVTNVVRHAQATELAVRLEREADKVRLTVEDNGCGLDKETPIGIGIAGIRQRASECGGIATWTTGADGRGTRLEVEVTCHD